MSRILIIVVLCILTIGTPIVAQIPTDGLVAYYPFNGNANDESGNGNSGTLEGSPTLTTDRFGRLNSAYQFNGSTDYILVNNSDSFPDSAITVAFWFNRDGVVPTGLENYLSKEHSFQSYMYSDSTMSTGVWRGTAGSWANWLDSAYKAPMNEWVFYAFTYSNSSQVAKTYINGTLISTQQDTDMAAIVRTSSYPMYIGRNGSSSVYFINGKMDDIRIYGRVLSDNEVNTLYLPTTTGVKSHSPMPFTFSLSQNYPNPFNPSTRIQYALSIETKVRLVVYSLLGQVVAELVNGVEMAGYKSVEWNASAFSSGIYFYRLEATSISDASKTFTSVKKMLLIK